MHFHIGQVHGPWSFSIEDRLEMHHVEYACHHSTYHRLRHHTPGQGPGSNDANLSQRVAPCWTNTKETRVMRKGHQEGIARPSLKTNIHLHFSPVDIWQYVVPWGHYLHNEIYWASTQDSTRAQRVESSHKMDVSGRKCLSVNEHHRGHALFPFFYGYNGVSITIQGVIPSMDEIAFKLIVWSWLKIGSCIRCWDENHVELSETWVWERRCKDPYALLGLSCSWSDVGLLNFEIDFFFIRLSY